MCELLNRLGGWPGAAPGAGAGGGGGGGVVGILGARGTRVGAGASGAEVLDGRSEIRLSADTRGAEGGAEVAVGGTDAVREDTLSGAGVVSAGTERRASRRLRRSLAVLGGFGAAVVWGASASEEVPGPGGSAGEVAAAVEDGGRQR